MAASTRVLTSSSPTGCLPKVDASPVLLASARRRGREYPRVFASFAARVRSARCVLPNGDVIVLLHEQFAGRERGREHIRLLPCRFIIDERHIDEAVDHRRWPGASRHEPADDAGAAAVSTAVPHPCRAIFSTSIAIEATRCGTSSHGRRLFRRAEAAVPGRSAGKTLAMLFDKPSTRPPKRASPSKWHAQLGGEVVMASPASSPMGPARRRPDTARVLVALRPMAIMNLTTHVIELEENGALLQRAGDQTGLPTLRILSN